MRPGIVCFIVLLCLINSACNQAQPTLQIPTIEPTSTLTIVPTPTVQPTSTIEPTPAPQLIEVQGRKLSIQCLGDGSPVVILESGLGVYSGTWYKVVPEIAKFTRVCIYDRYGLGLSEPPLTPRTSDHMVAELHELLTKAQVSPPYILVGQSFGGLNIHLFASTYPQEVVGLVFVDAIHPDFDNRLEPLLSPAQAQQRREDLELNQEGIKFKDILASEDQVRAAGPVPDVPIIVIRHGIPFEGGADWPTEKVEALWEELQNDLATLSSQGKVILAENSHHRIEEDRPDVVIAAIQEIFKQVHK
jgi:pimeloyl-ACP methyl ester carboxylesterase